MGDPWTAKAEWSERNGKVYDSTGTEVSLDEVAKMQRRIDLMRRGNAQETFRAPGDLHETMRQMTDLAERGQVETYKKGQEILGRQKNKNVLGQRLEGQ